MIQVCPHCGFQLPEGLKEGLAHCVHCNQLFDSSDYNKLLSAAWQLRKHPLSLEDIKWQIKLDEDYAILAHTYICEYGYNHEEFNKLLKKFGVANKSYIDYSKSELKNSGKPLDPSVKEQ